MPESRDKFSVWSSTEFLESDYDFLSKKKQKQKKKTGGVALHPEGGYNRVYFFVADGIITGEA